MMTPRMRQVEIHLLKTDLAPVLAHLGKRACLQLIGGGDGPEPDSGHRRLFRGLQAARRYLGLDDIAEIGPDTPAPDAAMEREAQDWVERCAGLRAEGDALLQRWREASDALAEARNFAGLGMSFAALSRVSLLAVRIGRLPGPDQEGLKRRLAGKALLLDLGGGRLAVLAAGPSREGLDESLRAEGFIATPLPPDFDGMPEDLIAGLEAHCRSLQVASGAVEERRLGLRAEVETRLPVLLASIGMGSLMDSLASGLEASESTYSLRAWVLAKDLPDLAAELEDLTQDRVAIRAFEPRDLASVRSGAEQVPVKLVHGPFVSSFERLVVSYGLPLYGTVDPTPFVAFFFVLLFALMFGDLGQGALILVLGLVLGFRRLPAGLARFRAYAPILRAVGAASMLTGLLYGSVFSNDELLVPFSRWVTACFGVPSDHIVSLLPSGGFERLLAFFGFSLGVGAVLNSIGLVLNVLNQWRLGRRERALFGKTGLAGALFFWYGLAFALRLALGGTPAWFDIPGFSLPALALLAGPGAWRRLHPEEGEATGAFQALVELVETFSYYLSNTVSFLRVGAFALAHAVLSLCVFTLSDLAGSLAVAGPAASVLVMVAGNLVILVLEGMIVAIQATRLHYYEFFSKFLTETGVEFRPFRFDYRSLVGKEVHE